jgi:hypothetical protein
MKRTVEREGRGKGIALSKFGPEYTDFLPVTVTERYKA